jgi:acetyltransferase EpsM
MEGVRQPIVIVGAGGLGSEVRDAIDAVVSLEFVGYLDDHRLASDVLGPVTAGSIPDGAAVVVAVGESTIRRQLLGRLGSADFVTVVHPSAVVSPSATIGVGSYVAAFCFVGPNATVGRSAMINVHAEVGHDATVGHFVTISPQAALNGGSRVGDGCFLGHAASIAPGVTVGAWSKIAAASRVTVNVDDGWLVTGNPARGRRMFDTGS